MSSTKIGYIHARPKKGQREIVGYLYKKFAVVQPQIPNDVDFCPAGYILIMQAGKL